MILRILTFFSFFLLLSSCLVGGKNSPSSTSSDELNLLQSGDIVVANVGNDSIVLLDSDGNFKETLVDIQTNASILFNGLTYDPLTKNILYIYDHATAALDAVRYISPVDGSTGEYLSNGQLSGVLPGLTRLTGGDLLVLETTLTAEKFNSSKVRQGAPFTAALTATVADVAKLATGGFVACSSGTANTVRTYNLAGVLQATATSASPLPTLGALGASSCIQTSSGLIIVAYTGATDAVRAYNSTLTTVQWTFSDQNILSTPGKLALAANGNIYITDTLLDHIVEISSSGGYVQLLGGSVLSTPTSITVVP